MVSILRDLKIWLLLAKLSLDHIDSEVYNIAEKVKAVKRMNHLFYDKTSKMYHIECDCQ
jgi:hypothetical protein